MIKIDELKAYVEGDILTSWDGEVDAAALEATRVTLRTLANKLIKIAPNASIDTIGNLFTNCVERFNELDIEHEFIMTIEREDLCDELYTLGEHCGAGDEVDDWLEERDW